MALAYAQAQPVQPNQLHSPAIVFANLPFKGLADEIERRSNIPKREVDTQIERIVDAWKRFTIAVSVDGCHTPAWVYSKALEASSGINCTAKDLEGFMNALTFQDIEDFDTAGFFINALINTGPDQRYIVRTDHLDVRIDALGSYNEKEVIIEGNAGRHVGLCMKKGRVIVTGDADSWAGIYMEGGSLIIVGDVGSNANQYTGYNMKSGEIHIGGRCIEAARFVYGGKIFIGGVQIHPPYPEYRDRGTEGM